MRFSSSDFFHESVFPRPLGIPLDRFVTKINGDIYNFVFIACVVDTGDKLFAGVNDTGDKLFQQNKKKLPVSKSFTFIAGIVDTVDQPLLTNISANIRKKFVMARGKLIHETSLKSTISCQTPFNARPVVVLDERGERLLEDAGAEPEVGKRGEDLPVDLVEGLAPVLPEPRHNRPHPLLLLLQALQVT
jgi:hypothetical protein